MESWLREPALASPEFALARQQPVADQPLEKGSAKGKRLDEVAAVGRQHLFDVIRVIEKVCWNVKEARANDVSVFARQPFEEAQGVAIKFRHDAQKKVAFWAIWNGWLGFDCFALHYFFHVPVFFPFRAILRETFFVLDKLYLEDLFLAALFLVDFFLAALFLAELFLDELFDASAIASMIDLIQIPSFAS